VIAITPTGKSDGATARSPCARMITFMDPHNSKESRTQTERQEPADQITRMTE